MNTVIWTILGSLSTALVIWLRWKFDPQRKIDALNAECAHLAVEEDRLKKERDDAIVKQDNDALTVAVHGLTGVHNDQARVLQRLRTHEVQQSK